MRIWASDPSRSNDHGRDSKTNTRPTLRVSHEAWAGFVALASSERCI
ncbi:DUF397 domain-containing protein [Streptomyces sp. NPDC127084]